MTRKQFLNKTSETKSTNLMINMTTNSNYSNYDGRRDDIEELQLIEPQSNTQTAIQTTTQSATTAVLIQDNQPIEYCYPYFTIRIIVVQFLVYLIGLYLLGFNQLTFTLYSPISLPFPSLYFDTVSSWPQCQNLKPQLWRLLSHQFVHAGVLHILSNQFMTLFFGVILEMSYGFWKSLAIYEFGILGGILLHASCLPYRGLVGCSHGVYSLYGACFSLCLTSFTSFTSRSSFSHSIYFNLIYLSLLFQIFSDILAFLFYFTPSVGYVAHIGGFLSGFFLGLIFLPSSQSSQSSQSTQSNRLSTSSQLKRALFFSSFLIYFGCLLFLLLYYLHHWPPQSPIPFQWYHWLIHNQNNKRSCCQLMFDLILHNNLHNVSFSHQIEHIQNHFYCNGTRLIPY